MTRLMSLAAVVFAGALFFACTPKQAAAPETGELAWPEITSQTKPWTRWWWPASAVSESDIISMLDAYSEAGLGGTEVTTIYGAKGYEDAYKVYLSPEWMKLFTFTLDESKKRDMGVDLANASGWPFGGNWVTPDYACRYLEPVTYTLKGGESLSEKITCTQRPILRTLGEMKTSWDQMKFPVVANDNLQQIAFDQVRYPVELPLIAVTLTALTASMSSSPTR